MKLRNFLVALVAGVLLLGGAVDASAIVLLGGDQEAHFAAPPNGAPWKHVARLGLKASGVYIGNRYILTAQHADYPDVIHLNGSTWAPDTAWGERQIGNVDLKLIRMVKNPGLPTMPLIRGNENELGRVSTIIGWGVGPAQAIPNRGWKWGDDSTRVQRWGLNKVAPYLANRFERSFLFTAFNFTAGPEEACIAAGDSGCGIFQKFASGWKLVGIGVDTDTFGSALYDNNPGKSGRQPDCSYYIRVRDHRAAILSMAGVGDAAGLKGEPAGIKVRPKRSAERGKEGFPGKPVR